MYFTAGGQRDPHNRFHTSQKWHSASINNSPWDAHEDNDTCLFLTSLHFPIMTVIIAQVAVFKSPVASSTLSLNCYASPLATLASVTSECGDREVHGVVEEFGQNQGRVRQCCLFVRNRSLPRRLRVSSFIIVRWHFSAKTQFDLDSSPSRRRMRRRLHAMAI